VPWAPRLSLSAVLLSGYFSFEDDPYACTERQVRDLRASEIRPGFTACAPMRWDLKMKGSGPDGIPDGDVLILFGGAQGMPLTITQRRTPFLP
jgi:hypothetical protein